MQEVQIGNRKYSELAPAFKRIDIKPDHVKIVFEYNARVFETLQELRRSKTICLYDARSHTKVAFKSVKIKTEIPSIENMEIVCTLLLKHNHSIEKCIYSVNLFEVHAVENTL